MQSGLADFDVKGFDDALLKQGTSVHSPLEFLLLGTGRSTHQIFLSIIVAWQLKLQIFFSKWLNRPNHAEPNTVLIGGGCIHHMRHAAASQSPVFACSPGNCTSYTSHFGRRTSNKKMMMSWYPKQPDITSFKWMFLDFQPFPFLKIWNNLELSNRNNHFF